MKPRSLRFKLIASFAGLSVLVMSIFGAYVYSRLERFLVEVQRSALVHRTEQIAALLRDVPRTGEPFVITEIEARFAPELNDKFVRVTRFDGTKLFLSGVPYDNSFDPESIPPLAARRTQAGTRREKGYEEDVLISNLSVPAGNGGYLIEVGASLGASYHVLRALLLTLVAGSPVVMAIGILGGYMLVHRALGPVQNIMRAAQDITLHHLSRRLPVPNSGDEIESLSLVLNQMIARLDESFQNTSRFTADASHELRTPLTIIRGELEALASRNDLASEIRDSLGSLLEEIERLVQIVEGLFALSRLDTGEAQTECVRLNLAQLAETTAEQMCLLAEEKRISLVCETRETVEVEGDRSRLKQVIVNLLDNAIKYSQPGGRVALAVRAQNGSAVLEISDNGPGVPEAALPHLFERFYRADEVRSRSVEGAGLGLSIVHSICSAHAGNVAIQNVSPHGCRVAVTLPRAF